MSNLFKFILMALAWALLWAVSYYGCINPDYCLPDEGEVITAPVQDDYSIVSSLGSNDVETGALWAAERDALLARYQANPDQLLEVTGNYYESEGKPADFLNMGLLRADKIKQILLRETDIPAESIVTVGRLISGTPATEQWVAGSFRMKEVVDESEPEKSEVIDLGDDNVLILFPYNADQKEVDPAVDDYLAKLAERLQQTNETVTLTGHTDDKGRPEYNMDLGQRRADFVKEILVRNGAPAARITTVTKGETTPRVPNTSTANRRENRRVEVVLSAQ